MLRTAEPRSPRFTTTSLDALAPPEAEAPGSASAGTRRDDQHGQHEQAREMRTTHGVEDPCHQTFPLSSAYGVS